VVTKERLLQRGEIDCLLVAGSAKCGSLNERIVGWGLKGVGWEDVGSVQSGVSGSSVALDVEHPETGSCVSL